MHIPTCYRGRRPFAVVIAAILAIAQGLPLAFSSHAAHAAGSADAAPMPRIVERDGRHALKQDAHARTLITNNKNQETLQCE